MSNEDLRPGFHSGFSKKPGSGRPRGRGKIPRIWTPVPGEEPHAPVSAHQNLSNNRQNFPGFAQGRQRRFARQGFKLEMDRHLKNDFGVESHHDLGKLPASPPFDGNNRSNWRTGLLQGLVSFRLAANYHVANMADTQEMRLTVFWQLLS